MKRQSFITQIDFAVYLLIVFLAGAIAAFTFDRFSAAPHITPTVTREQMFDSGYTNVSRSMQQAAADQLDSFYYYAGKADAYFETRKLLK